MGKVSVHPRMIRLSPGEFKEWLEERHPGEDWKYHYKSIGGKIESRDSDNSKADAKPPKADGGSGKGK